MSIHFNFSDIAHLTGWSGPKPPSPKPRPRITYVYCLIGRILGSGSSWKLKIGHSYDPVKRSYQFNHSMESVGHLVAYIECPKKEDACALEKHLHKRFCEYTAYGDSKEWFDPAPPVISFLLSLGVNTELYWKNGKSVF